MRITSAARTHVGRRSNNEDSHCAIPALGLYAVADGMGGYDGGEVASKLAIDAVRHFVRDNVGGDNPTWPFPIDPLLDLDESLMSIAARLAHRDVAQQRVGPLSQMGSTLSALAIVRGHAVLAHVGDSRVYRLRAGVFEQLTNDHSVYAELFRANNGAMPPKSECAYGHMITRALGMDREPMPDTRRERLAVGDTFLLCSDGLTEELTDAQLAELVALPELDVACETLVQRAYDAGGRDNITVVLVRVEP